MTTSFETEAQLFITSESATEGHPGKLGNQVSDAVLDAILRRDPHARMACDVCTTSGILLVCGEVTTTASVDTSAIARDTVRRVGYDRPELGFDADHIAVLVGTQGQSPDIDLGCPEPGSSRRARERRAWRTSWR